MNKISLKKNAYIRLVRFSLAYSFIIMLTITMIAFLNYKKASLETIEKELTSISNSFNDFTIEENFPLLIKRIQERTNLQEFILYDRNCFIKASTSLAQVQDCTSPQGDFQQINVRINSKEYTLLYRLNYSLQSFIKQNLQYIFYLFISIFLITALIFVYFFKISFIRPIEHIRKSLLADRILLPKEFDFIGNKILELQGTIQKREKEKHYFNIARQVVHDIRNPLSHMKSLAISNSLTNTDILRKVDEIEFHITNLLRTKQKNSYNTNITVFFNTLSNEIKLLFNLSVLLNVKDDSFIHTQLHEFDYKNIFLNLARNASEAAASNLLISFYKDQHYAVFYIKDDGTGISNSIASKLFHENVSTKDNGNGIGLNGLKTILENVGGTIQLLPDSTKGAHFEIKVPLLRSSSDEAILIDNDKFIHASWAAMAKKSGKKVHSFFSVKEFLIVHEDLNKDIPVYIDSDLGDDKAGEILSKDIFEKGFKNIFLATGFTDIDLNNFPWIKATVNKSPPFMIH